MKVAFQDSLDVQSASLRCTGIGGRAITGARGLHPPDGAESPITPQPVDEHTPKSLLRSSRSRDPVDGLSLSTAHAALSRSVRPGGRGVVHPKRPQSSAGRADWPGNFRLLWINRSSQGGFPAAATGRGWGVMGELQCMSDAHYLDFAEAEQSEPLANACEGAGGRS